MTEEQRKRLLEKFSKSQRSRAIAAINKNTPESVATEIFELEEKIKDLTNPNRNNIEGVEDELLDDELIKKNYLNRLRQRHK